MVYAVYIENRRGRSNLWHVEMTPAEAQALSEDLDMDVERGVLSEGFVVPPATLTIPLGDFIRVAKQVEPNILKKRWAP